ncbi:hypothetical protein GCM10010252_59600 [Streptomyces aureoverticillatus]|nr:hypothetical protein GCM10010252_59600 [Streptomyces aureoverticillatus]
MRAEPAAGRREASVKVTFWWGSGHGARPCGQEGSGPNLTKSPSRQGIYDPLTGRPERPSSLRQEALMTHKERVNKSGKRWNGPKTDHHGGTDERGRDVPRCAAGGE